MTRSEIFKAAHQICRFKDEKKVGNNIFRFLGGLQGGKKVTYAMKFAASLKYIYKQIKKSDEPKPLLNAATQRQYEYLIKFSTVYCEINYAEFASKFSKSEASCMIDAAKHENEYLTLK